MIGGRQAQQAAQFNVGTLHRRELDPDPLIQFHAWFSDPDPALRGTAPETCTLSTARLPSGRVSSRVVYLKELDARGFVVYSNWETSNKAKDWASNGWVSLCFWWKGQQRQVRVEGKGERLSEEESQVYYDTRARGSRIGAWASRQSEVLSAQGGDDDGRELLDQRVREVERRFEGQEQIPVPPFWGGLRIVPDMVEFWQGRESRLHDRFRYTLEEGGSWRVERLSP
ncbi:hypothetical protein DV737_g4612, partial [Chaetothyriales sp. CBS 132003]